MLIYEVGKLPELVKFLFKRDLGIDFENYRSEFKELRISTNIERGKKGAVGILLLNLGLLLVDIFVYKSMRAETPAYLYLYYSHIVTIFLVLTWFVIIGAAGHRNNGIGVLLYQGIINIAMYWCVFMGINSLCTSGHITAYLICPLAISAWIYLTPKECFVTLITSMIVFVILLAYNVGNDKSLYSHIINAGIVVFFAILISNMNYSSFAKDFINKKDIIKSKRELEQINEKLKEYERLRTDFFGNISHELRTPLNVIYSAQQMLDATLKLNDTGSDKTDKYIKMIKQNSYRLIRLINNLIDITKIDSSNFEVKLRNRDIIKVVEDITMSVSDYIETKGINLIFDTEVEERIIACDGDIIERIMLNLLSNAIKFTESGGQVTVNVFLGLGEVFISVKDTGAGIPENMKDLIFDRFIQADNSNRRRREGSGIGLALVKSLVEIQGGCISVKSKIGEGSEFLIALPDRRVEESEEVTYCSNHCGGSIEIINIEFSDIYE